MTTVLRRPLTNRHPDQPTRADKLISPLASQLVPTQSSTTVAVNKRPRSPGADETTHAGNIKRIKPTSSHTLALTTASNNTTTMQSTAGAQEIKERRERLRQKEERQLAKEEFVAKYTKAFPSFVFYFDERDGGRQQVESRILALGARIEHFFSASVTHVITNRPQPPKNEQYDPSNKENAAPRVSSMKVNILKSPIQLKPRNHDHGAYDKLVRDAVQLDKKIWNLSKLENILSRLLPLTSNASKTKTGNQSPPLTQLLQHERLHGTTSERDPRERRHDYQYFSKGSHFLLVEDIWGELAPIAIMEYSTPVRSAEKDKSPAYPVLYMDPRARSPFVKFDEKEARKQEKIETNEKLKEKEKEKHRVKVKEQLKRQQAETHRKTKTLRRRASMSHLGRRVVTLTELENLGTETSGNDVGLPSKLRPARDNAGHHQVASGFGPSTTGFGTGNGYLAASGNSVAITSTTTTSFARTLGNSRLPPNLREQLGRQVVTSRRLEGPPGKGDTNLFESRLRKAKSTTTMRLPARQESKKPGYCEACRIKFEDFTEHIRGARHRKFAQNENNYIDLDFLLRRLQRRLKTDESSDEGSPDGDIIFEDDSASDACLGPGDYFYLSPKQELQAEVEEDSGDEDQSECEERTDVPRIVVDDDEI